MFVDGDDLACLKPTAEISDFLGEGRAALARVCLVARNCGQADAARGKRLFEFAHRSARLPSHADIAGHPADRPHVCLFARDQILVAALRGRPVLIPLPFPAAPLARFLGTCNCRIGDAVFPGPVVGIAIVVRRCRFGGAVSCRRGKPRLVSACRPAWSRAA